MGLLVDAQLAGVTGRARKVIYSRRGYEALRYRGSNSSKKIVVGLYVFSFTPHSLLFVQKFGFVWSGIDI
ncbi:hypothetical protein [Pseudoalteromonas sp. C12FD-1]|uniref:hypothetical protein n=1 Tax=Pseudoalteromonas sp. C12FD-1 TaxID=3131979 RepID=UPI00307D680E